MPEANKLVAEIEASLANMTGTPLVFALGEAQAALAECEFNVPDGKFIRVTVEVVDEPAQE